MFQRSATQTELDREIKKLLSELDVLESVSEEYGTVLDRVSKLHKLKETEKNPWQVSPDTAVLAVTNLLGILLIIRHEHVNVISSKATGFVKRL